MSLDSVTLYRARITVVEWKSITSMFIHKLLYENVIPDKSCTAPYKDIFLFTEALTLSDIKAFYTTTHVVLYEEGDNECSKMITCMLRS
jgi:hypothetical protein